MTRTVPPPALSPRQAGKAGAFGPPTANQQSSDSGSAIVDPGAGAEILLVEDNLDNRNLTRQILESNGFRVQEAAEGAEALERLAEFQFDLILMDIQMPVMDGFEATTRLRAQEQAEGRPRTPVIAFTAHAEQECRSQALVAGMDEYLTKPARAEQLLATVRRRIDARPVILIVDDSPEDRDLVKRFLDKDRSLLAITANPGECAREVIRQRRVSAVLLNFEMPGRLAERTMAEIRRIPGREKLPVIAMIRHSGSAAHRSALQAGCTDTLEKPPRRGQVAAVVQRHVNRSPCGGVPPWPPEPRVDPREEVVSVNPAISDLVERLLGGARRDCARLAQHLERPDFQAAAEIGHNLKGTGATFGFPRLSEIGSEVERASRAQRPDALAEGVSRLWDYLDGVRWKVRESRGTGSGV